MSLSTTAIGTFDGVLNVRKETGWTSHDVVAKLRGHLKGRRIGHAGTLDPAATGVLPVLLGRATRIAEYLVGWDKEYVAVLRLGETTDTLDATGTVLGRRSAGHLSEETIRSVVRRFEGILRQVPPMYSAVKVDGVPLYKSARAGRTVARPAREVVVYRLEVLHLAGPDVTLRVACSKGTYVRTLCADIGEALGVGGHLASLERTRVGPLTIDRALSVADACARLDTDRADAIAPHLMSLDEALAELPALILTTEAAAGVFHGVPVLMSGIMWKRSADAVGLGERHVVRLKDAAGRLLALGTMPGVEAGATRAAGTVQVTKVLITQPSF